MYSHDVLFKTLADPTRRAIFERLQVMSLSVVITAALLGRVGLQHATLARGAPR